MPSTKNTPAAKSAPGLGSNPAPRQKRRQVNHACAACNSTFARKRDCFAHMDECPEVKKQLAAKLETAKRWAVLFDTKNGMTHPKWYSNYDGSLITREAVEREAEKALKNEADWLVGIQDISPSED